jgi:hypothetical protein
MTRPTKARKKVAYYQMTSVAHALRIDQCPGLAEVVESMMEEIKKLRCTKPSTGRKKK